jgi:hypothetical protein
VSGPWRMGRHLVVISLIGGARLDLSQAELAARDVTLTKVSVIQRHEERQARHEERRRERRGY